MKHGKSAYIFLAGLRDGEIKAARNHIQNELVYLSNQIV